MKIREGVVTRRVMGKTLVVAVGAAAKDFHAMIELNATAESIWNYLSEERTTEELTALLCEEYDVSADIAAAAVGRFLDTLRTEGLLTE